MASSDEDNPQADYENEKYHHEMDQLELENVEQQQTIERLLADLHAWQTQSAKQSTLTDQLQAEIERLRAENEELKAALALLHRLELKREATDGE